MEGIMNGTDAIGLAQVNVGRQGQQGAGNLARVGPGVQSQGVTMSSSTGTSSTSTTSTSSTPPAIIPFPQGDQRLSSSTMQLDQPLQQPAVIVETKFVTVPKSVMSSPTTTGQALSSSASSAFTSSSTSAMVQGNNGAAATDDNGGGASGSGIAAIQVPLIVIAAAIVLAIGGICFIVFRKTSVASREHRERLKAEEAFYATQARGKSRSSIFSDSPFTSGKSLPNFTRSRPARTDSMTETLRLIAPGSSDHGSDHAGGGTRPPSADSLTMRSNHPHPQQSLNYSKHNDLYTLPFPAPQNVNGEHAPYPFDHTQNYFPLVPLQYQNPWMSTGQNLDANQVVAAVPTRSRSESQTSGGGSMGRTTAPRGTVVVPPRKQSVGEISITASRFATGSGGSSSTQARAPVRPRGDSLPRAPELNATKSPPSSKSSLSRSGQQQRLLPPVPDENEYVGEGLLYGKGSLGRSTITRADDNAKAFVKTARMKHLSIMTDVAGSGL